jgi:hypothetical protein
MNCRVLCHKTENSEPLVIADCGSIETALSIAWRIFDSGDFELVAIGRLEFVIQAQKEAITAILVKITRNGGSQ